LTDKLNYLFKPLDLGPFTLRNRLICTGHNPHYDEDGLIGDQQIAFHARKAEGGMALSTTGATTVHPSGGMLPEAPLINHDESVIPGYQRLAEAMHEHGARMLVQLIHAASAIASRRGGHVLWAPSQTIGEFAHEPPHVMTTSEIGTIVDAFAQASVRVRTAGLDGVELNGFAGALIQQFLSPQTNRRTDEYGGSLENRLRFLTEVITVCREALGKDLALMLKLAGDELYEEGLHLPDMQEIVRHIDELGMIDMYVVASGNNLERFARIDHWPPTPAPHGLHVRLAKGIREVTSTPVAALCRIVDPRYADQLIAEGSCDVVAMVRATLADPDIANKAAAGRFDDIRPCVGANTGCVDRIIAGGEARCIYNPIVGHERQWGSLPKADVVRKIVVIGGGPAGLEAARVAAERGHQVTLLERTSELGGTARVVARKPGREELIGIPNWLAGQVEKLGVEIHLKTEATVERILAEQPDAVVLATGAHDTPPNEDFGEADIRVATAWSLLDGSVVPGSNVLVVDHSRSDTGCSVAELVADSGGRAEVISRQFHPAIDFGLTNTISLYRRLFRKDVELTAHHDLGSIRDGAVHIVNCYSGKERRMSDLDMVVFVTVPTPSDELLAPLQAAGVEVHAIGDCVAPGDIENATFEGHRVAREL
jgi:2,4-dienoyl-CoA reductase-like NADH-dependent reductase (Old Yellow Enzyme family)/NAD(P)-dependent dehydrogenase (short-subunit alcohol dehydrogenase family)